ncbi:hypothetical protein NL676_014709 [Syzygium grande]|nr:hypothetical protein NL676_014709 [Syzygium grande]
MNGRKLSKDPDATPLRTPKGETGANAASPDRPNRCPRNPRNPKPTKASPCRSSLVRTYGVGIGGSWKSQCCAKETGQPLGTEEGERNGGQIVEPQSMRTPTWGRLAGVTEPCSHGWRWEKEERICQILAMFVGS